VKASGSVGANYIEANESLSKKDFKYRIKICRKEAKESAYWLRLIKETNPPTFADEATLLFNEANELEKDFFCNTEEIQIKFEIPTRRLEFWIWNLFGICYLELGIFLTWNF